MSSLILGILSIPVLGFILGFIAVALAGKALKRHAADPMGPHGHRMAKAGLVLGWIGMIGWWIGMFVWSQSL